MRFLFFPILFFVASCGTQKKVTPVPAPVLNVTVKPLPYQPTAQKDWELIHTAIDILFNFEDKTANATSKISMHPYFYATDSVVLDAKHMEIMEVKDGQNNNLIYTYDNLKLHIKLSNTYNKQDTLALVIKYIAMPYASETHFGQAIQEDRGLYFVNADKKEPFQPLQVWTQGEPEDNSHWFPTIDKPNFRSSFEITMHVPDSLTTLGNGILTKSVKEKNNYRADTWFQKLPIPPYLVMMAVGNFHVEKDFWNKKEVNYLVPQKYAPYAKAIFNHTPEMISYFSNLLKVDFPWDKYSQVVAYNYVSGAMENVSASLFGAFLLKDNRQLKDDNNDNIVAHELFHQWFGDYVTAESWSQLTLNESFADYGEKLWTAYKYGVDAAEVERIKSWNQYSNQAETNDPPLVRFNYHQPDDVFDRVSYSKGGLILHYLQKIVGKKAFFESLNLYLTENALQSAEADQLRLSFEKVTGRDLKWFFDEWYFSGGHPILTFDYEYAADLNKMTVTVTQNQNGPIYRLPFKVQVVRNGQSQMVDWEITEKQQRFTLPYASDEELIVIPDAEFWIPGGIDDNKNARQNLLQIKYGNGVMARYRALTLFDYKSTNADTILQFIELGLKDKSPFIRSTALQYFYTKGGASLAKGFINLLGAMAANDPDNDVKSAAIYLLGQLKTTNFSTIYEIAVADSSYKVAAAGLYAMEQINHNKASQLARKMLDNNINSAMFTSMAARIIAVDAEESDFAFFEKTIWHYFERERTSFLYAFYSYIENMKNPAIFNQGVDLAVQLIENDVTNKKSIASPQLLFYWFDSAKSKMKANKGSADASIYKANSDYALAAYKKVKLNLKNPALIQELNEMEKEME